MSDEREYVSILDGVDDDEGTIIIVPDDNEVERDYSEHTSFLGAVAESEGYEKNESREPQKRTISGMIKNFWYYHKNAVIIIVFTVGILAVLFAVMGAKKSNDLTIAVYSDNYYSENKMIVLKLFFSNNVEDFNNDNSHTVEADFIIGRDEYAAAQAEADYKNRIRCIYLATEESFDYLSGLYPDMFESYNGCALWIPLSGTDLCDELKVNGFDASDLGISLLAKPDEESETYNRAINLLDALREKYPEVFD